MAEQSDASVSKFFSLDLERTELVCLCYVDRPSNAKLHYAVRRLTKKSKSAYVMVLLLGSASEAWDEEKVVGFVGRTKNLRGSFGCSRTEGIEASKVSAITPEPLAPSASATD